MNREKLREILKSKFSSFQDDFFGDLDAYLEEVAQEIENMGEEKKEEEKPVLVGHLNKRFGYNGYKPAEKGTEVFQVDDKFFFNIFPQTSDKPVIMRFYKETLKPCIDFI